MIAMVDDAKFLETFRLLAPDLADAKDDLVLAYRKLAEPMISESKFGDLYPQALVYLTAHRMAYQNLIAEGGSSSGAVIAGNVISEKEGDLQRSYGSAGGGTSGNGSNYTGAYDKTAYGILFKQMRDMRILAAATRFG